MLSKDRIGRAWRRVRSRGFDYTGLIQAHSVPEILAWKHATEFQGFNGNAMRAKIVHSVVAAAGCKLFIETGTSHAATAICARRLLGLPVQSCELSLREYLISRLLTFGMSGVTIHHLDSRSFLEEMVHPLSNAEERSPFFYLDAHEGSDPTSLPLVEEIGKILALKSFVVMIDDFRVPEVPGFLAGSYGGSAIEGRLIRDLLLAAEIRKCWLPAYSPAEDTGHCSGYCLFWRNSALDVLAEGSSIAMGLLRPYDLELRRYT